MGLARYKAPDGKYAWYNDEKHSLVNGELVLKNKKAPAPSTSNKK